MPPARGEVAQNKQSEKLMRGAGLFLICSGPSLKTMPLHLLEQRGIVTLAVNNAWSMIRPNYWICVDPPHRFLYQGWWDPGIEKWIPFSRYQRGEGDKNCLSEKKNGEFTLKAEGPNSCPNVHTFVKSNTFSPHTFFTGGWQWGPLQGDPPCYIGLRNGRSVMFPAIRLAYEKGFSRIYLVGCDFHMPTTGAGYAFEQERSDGTRKNNNNSYRKMDARFKVLRPELEKRGVEVINVTPESHLTAFEHGSFEEAVELETQRTAVPIDTVGWYRSLKNNNEERDY